MVRRYQPLVLCRKQIVHGVLDDDEKWSYEHVIAHVTEVNGAQRQNDLFGKSYSMTWAARLQGDHQADAVAFPEPGIADNDLTMLPVIQIRKHATRTDVYFALDREVNSDELE